MPVRLLLVWLALVAAAPVSAGERYAVGVENIDYRPYQAGHTGVFEGFGRELLDAFATEAGIVFEYRPLPPPRLLASLLQDRIDFKYPDDPGWAPEARAGQVIHYSRPIVAYLDGTLVRPERLGQPVSMLRVLGTVVGFTPLAWRAAIESGAVSLRENADFGALFQQVLSGRIDGAYANVAVARDQSQRLFGHPDALVFDHRLPFARGDYRLSTRRHPQVIARFDRWLLDRADRVSELKRRAGLSETDPDHDALD
ncbi:transporter substrate-binding domain-containing protein [Thermochromatium tepidum]|uniref:transporter substrate-binding domain-containing protein n=1 Tax=Thermochromatium tepidum TaxID=1050 RepID=UPI001FE3A70C|nr:transporter substrate-binding domain-containing protein [Thermochromatium tepidum]